MSFTLCTSGAIQQKAGLNVNSLAVTSGSLLAQFSDEAEHLINLEARYDFIANYSLLNSNVKNILSECASSLGAMNLIIYDMSGYTSRGEAEDMVSFLNFKAQKILDLIGEDKYRGFLLSSAGTGVK